jgi:hypothetical protein
MNPYEAKQEARRERLEARAAKLRSEGNARVDRAHEMASHIPFGQPILIGHHSEKRDRNYRGRIRSNFEKGFETLKAASEASARAAAVGSGGISSDDPDAVAKLKAQLAALGAKQARQKAANAIIRKYKDLAIPHLIELGIEPPLAKLLLEPDFAGRIGYPSFRMTNLNANIRRLKQRIEHLERAAKREHKEVELESGLRIVENVEANRLQMFFPGKPPAAVIAELKSRGFRWAPSEGAWQRHLSNSARWAAGLVKAKWEESL